VCTKQLHLFLKEFERALFCLVARLCKALQGLLTGGVLLSGNNAPLLCLHQILASQAATGVLRLSMPHLRLCSHGGRLCATAHVMVSLTLATSHFLVHLALATSHFLVHLALATSHFLVHLALATGHTVLLLTSRTVRHFIL
jgi:hypothetical protein